MASEGTNWPRPKLFSEGTNGPELVSEAQIDFRKPKIGFRRPYKGTNWPLQKAKIGFRPKLASEGPKLLPKAKIIGFGRPKIGFRRPKFQIDFRRRKLGFRKPKLASEGQNWPQKAQIGFTRPTSKEPKRHRVALKRT